MSISIDSGIPNRIDQAGRSKFTTVERYVPWAFVGYLVFVVYGSLIPFEVRTLAFDEAWDRFLNIRYLNLGILSRADWVANIILYVPLAFLGAAWAHLRFPTQRISVIRLAGVILGCSSVAFTVEFLQVFFVPRTVSINDLIAESLGIGLGIAVWYASRSRLMQLLIEVDWGGSRAVSAALYSYILLYVALSLFPFDFLVSIDEISWKLSKYSNHFFFAPASCGDTLRCFVRLTVEMFAAVPFGVLLATRKIPMPRAIIYGALFGVIVEGLQFFIASGVSQGVSVLTRSAGTAFGVQAYCWLKRGGFTRYSDVISILLVVLFVPYLLLLTAVNGWFSNEWLSLADALLKIKVKMFLPFYFHYYSSEAGAMDSVLATIAMYAPFGMGYWIWTVAHRIERPATGAIVLAAIVSFTIEGGKLFVLGKHPDPTGILIALVSAGLAYKLSKWLSQTWLEQAPAGRILSESPPPPVAIERSRGGEVRSLQSIFSLALLAVVAWALTSYPVGASWLTALLIAYGFVLWRWPSLWLIMVPALLPVLDFAGRTGWIFLDEFDLLLMITLAVLLVRVGWRADAFRLSGHTAGLLVLFAVVYSISLIRGMLPLQQLDSNAFANYYSHYNALRVGKGVLWAIFLLPFLRMKFGERQGLERYFIPGVLCGFAATVALVVYERWLFPGVFNFSIEYRTTAFFSSMNTGGSSIDAYLAFSLPLVAACFLLWRNQASYCIGLVLYTLGLYSIFVTYSRVSYVAFGVAALVILAGLLRQMKSNRRFLAITLPLAAITAVIIVPILLAPYMQVRLVGTERDAQTRLDHWQETLSLRESGLASQLFGMGVGSFPRMYFWADPGPSRPASFTYASEGANTFLRLGSGRPLYVLQRIRAEQAELHKVSLDLRAKSDTSSLIVNVCEKSLLYSLRCESVLLTVGDGKEGWQTRDAGLKLQDFGATGRPVYLSMSNARAGTVVDIDNVSLQGQNGDELIANGDFAGGSDRWFFTSDDHLSWHVKNIWVYVLFEQGWAGLVLFALIVMLALTRLTKRAWGGDSISLVLLAALGAGLTVGMTDSILDEPRIALFFFLLLFASLLHTAAESYSDVQGQCNTPKTN